MIYGKVINSLQPSYGGTDLGQIGSSDGLLPGGTTPLLKAMLTFH